MKHKYSVGLVWSEEDKAFIANVPELPGCFSDGPTQEEALKNVEVVIDEWIETAKELKRPIPEPMDTRRLEAMAREFQEGLQNHIRREVESAVNRVLEDLARAQNPMVIMGTGQVLVGSVGDPSDWWKKSSR
jgi:predicted RNase H-like HicB family nuclease